MTSSSIISTCPFCGSSDLHLIADYGETGLCDDYRQTASPVTTYPLRLLLCKNCLLSFIDCVVDPSLIYEDYIYLTSSSPGLQAHFKNYADAVATAFLTDIDHSHYCIDIGGNDGTLLDSLPKSSEMRLLNIEPSAAASLASRSKGIDTYNGYFNSSAVDYILAQGKPSLVFMNNMFANIPDVHSFVRNLSLLFDDQTVAVIESSYLVDMVRSNVIDFVYHEHLYYLSLFPLQKLLGTFGLEIFDFQQVETKGGSYRYFISPIGARLVSHRVSTQLACEQAFIQSSEYSRWFEKTVSMISDLTSSLSVSQQSEICIYGASATTTTLLQLLPSSWSYSFMVDDNPAKHAKYSPTSPSLKVQTFDFLVEETPPVILIAAWRFLDLIVAKLNSIPNYNPLIIVPLPVAKVFRLSQYTPNP